MTQPSQDSEMIKCRIMRTIAIALLTTVSISCVEAQGDWPGYARDPGGQRFSPLAQVNTKNVAKLKLAWQYGIATAGVSALPEAVPIVVGGVMYAPTPQRTIVALDPETGKEIWKYELGRV